VVLARRFTCDATKTFHCPAEIPRGIRWPDGTSESVDAPTPPFAAGGGFVRVQDRYLLNGMSDNDKKRKMSLFDGARQEATDLPSGSLVFNFASAHAKKIFGIPYGIKGLADYMNAGIRDRMLPSTTQPDIRGRSGVYILDYIDESTAGVVWRTVVSQAGKSSA
jgi:hypothetical protein